MCESVMSAFCHVRLVDTLLEHLDRNNENVLPQLRELPRDITLEQAVATWKYVVSFQERQKQE